MNVHVRPAPPVTLSRRSGADVAVALPALERRRLQSYLALMCGDMAMLFVGFAAAGWLYLGTPGVDAGILLAQLLLPAYLTIGLYNGAYSLRALESADYGGARCVLALLVSSAVVVFVAFYTKSTHDFSRVAFTLSALAAAVLLPWCRAQMRSFVRWRCGQRVLNELVIDDGGPELNLPNIRHIEAGRYGLSPVLSDPAGLNRIGMILRNVDRVLVSCPPERRLAWALILKGANIEGEVIDDSIMLLGAKGARQAGGRGLLLVSLGPLGLRSRVVKRLFDLTIAATALLVMAPLLALVTVLIVLEDNGPALFVQRRMGRGNTFFSMYKFRSMSVARLDHEGACSASRDDVRVTRIGRIIRRTSIDELPQLRARPRARK